MRPAPRLRQLATAALLLAVVAPGPASASALDPAFCKHQADSTVSVDHSAYDKLLKAYVKPDDAGLNRIDYRGFKEGGHADLKAYLKTLEAVDVTALDRPEQIAFWSNLYNAKTLDIVLDHYPVKSIKEISLGGSLLAKVTGGPWKAKVTTVRGRALSLDDIEHAILRPVFKDPRIHYAVNCASIGCPNLAAEALTGANIERQLDAAARGFVNSPRGVRVQGGVVSASSIYSWFQVDFGGTDKGVLDHVKRYADPALKQKLDGITTIGEFTYDWGLNDAKK
jgi:hypothetical protein